MNTKTCKKCGIEKSISDFGKAGKQRLADGTLKQYYHTICKKCVNKGPRARTDNIDPKPCSQCGEVKPLSEYGKRENGRYRADCKACKYKRRLEHQAEHPEVRERIRQRDRWRRANEPGYRERQNATTNRSHAKHRDRRNREHRERYATDHEYREILLKRRRDFWENNPEYRERSKEINRLYHEEHKEELKVKHKIYYEENKEKISEYGKRYRIENADHCKKLREVQYQKHKDKLVQSQRDIRSKNKQICLDRLGNVCSHPGCNETKNLQFDHKNPWEKSFNICSCITKSLDELFPEVDKCQLLCLKHHMEKTAREWEDGTLYEKRLKTIEKNLAKSEEVC